MADGRPVILSSFFIPFLLGKSIIYAPMSSSLISVQGASRNRMVLSGCLLMYLTMPFWIKYIVKCKLCGILKVTKFTPPSFEGTPRYRAPFFGVPCKRVFMYIGTSLMDKVWKLLTSFTSVSSLFVGNTIHWHAIFLALVLTLWSHFFAFRNFNWIE